MVRVLSYRVVRARWKVVGRRRILVILLLTRNRWRSELIMCRSGRGRIVWLLCLILILVFRFDYVMFGFAVLWMYCTEC